MDIRTLNFIADTTIEMIRVSIEFLDIGKILDYLFAF
jgi:hypothetical protein